MDEKQQSWDIIKQACGAVVANLEQHKQIQMAVENIGAILYPKDEKPAEEAAPTDPTEGSTDQ